MFNSYNDRRVNITHQSPDTIKEIKAPTDDSIRFYEEMLAKAKSQIVDSIVLNDNILNVISVGFKDASLTGIDQREVFTKFKLNGREHLIKKVIQESDKRTSFTLNGKEIDLDVVYTLATAIAFELYGVAIDNRLKNEHGMSLVFNTRR